MNNTFAASIVGGTCTVLMSRAMVVHMRMKLPIENSIMTNTSHHRQKRRPLSAGFRPG